MGWFPKFRIAQKLPLAMVATALLVSAGVGLGSYLVGSTIVAEMSARQMHTVASSHADEFTTYLQTIQTDLVGSATTESLTGSMVESVVPAGKKPWDYSPWNAWERDRPKRRVHREGRLHRPAGLRRHPHPRRP